MREQGRAARVRCGFASYLGGVPWEDHWICEVQFDGRWQRVDAQLDKIFQKALEIDFACVDVPSEVFLTADEAWQR
jgi:hypothetical protein